MRAVFAGFVLVLAILLQGHNPAAASVDIDSEKIDAAPICPTRLHLRHPGMCSEQGSREDVVERALEGIDPQRPLPVSRIDPELGDIPYTYIRSKSKKGTPLYTSLEDAFAKEDPYRTVEPGFVFFSWIEQFKNDDGKKVYMIAPGVYVRSSGVSPLYLPTFRGMSFSRTPDKPFAWMLARNETRAGPGLDQPFTGRWLNRFDVVTVFDMEEIGNWTWYKVGPNDWVDDHSLGIVFPDSLQPEGVLENRWISINLYEQTMTAYENGEMVYATLISSGLDGWWTQPGVFQVYSKYVNDPMQGAFAADRSDYYYLEDVPWILYYDESRAIHGSYWHNGYGYPRSHGCVNISPADAEWFYNFADEGTWVYVFDPTGETPTDAELYGAGGA